MDMRPNYQLVLDQTLKTLAEKRSVGEEPPRLLLHACCAPCSSYVLEYLMRHFRITVFYYNPNISPESEAVMRRDELVRLISEIYTATEGAIRPEFLEGEYDPAAFYAAVKGHEKDREGGERCKLCFTLRLTEAARAAKEGGYDFFTTTLSISPLKNAALLNQIGAALADGYGVDYLFSDFKKKNGYKRSIELSARHHLYRQNYCGCVYSKQK